MSTNGRAPQPALSVLMPVFNEAATVRQAIAAVLDSELGAGTELIVVDDGSTDGSRELLAAGDWVAEGRDIATVVKPDAEVKIYLTADPAERARRREIPVEELHERDHRDQGHGRTTLEPSPGAITVDTTGMTLDEVVDRVAELAQR